MFLMFCYETLIKIICFKLRPLWAEFQVEQNIFSVENQYMIGDELIFCMFAPRT